MRLYILPSPFPVQYHRAVSLFRCVTSRFGVLVNMCVEVLHDVMDTTDEGVVYE